MRLTETTPFTLSPAAYPRQVTRNTEGLLLPPTGGQKSAPAFDRHQDGARQKGETNPD